MLIPSRSADNLKERFLNLQPYNNELSLLEKDPFCHP